MDLEYLREKSKKMLANFVNEIGLDGEYYASTCNCPMEWSGSDFHACGEYVSPSSKRLEKIIELSEYDEKTKRILNNRGLILVNNNYNHKEADRDLFVTIIHETIHSNRNLLLFDALRDFEPSNEERVATNENAYTFNNGKFEQNTSEYALSYADASQDILKGNIDTAQKTIDHYKDISLEELEEMGEYGKIGPQMHKQQIVDEALVELMAILSYKLYSNKEKGKSTDIWKTLEETRDAYESEDIGAMCKIILKHRDFELFNWMIDPITYSQGDIHYDFFGQYTKNDQDLLQELYESAGLDTEDMLGITETKEINIGDIKEVATSQIAIQKLPSSLQDIINALNRENIENERE